MPVSFKNPELEKLIDEITGLTGESKTEAVRRALEKRWQQLRLRPGGGSGKKRLLRFLEDEVWPQVPGREIGRRLSREEEEALLGYDERGV